MRINISCLYLALEGIYLPLRAAFPNSPTRRQRLVEQQGPNSTGFSPSPTSHSRELGPGPLQRTLLQTTIRGAKPLDFQAGHFPWVTNLSLDNSLNLKESEPWKERRELKRDVIRILLPSFKFEKEQYLNLSFFLKMLVARLAC